MADDVAVDDPPAADPAPASEPERWHGALVTSSAGQRVLHPSRDELVAVVRALRDADGFNMCLDLTGVDYLTYGAARGLPPSVTEERFEVVVTLMSHSRRERVRLERHESTTKFPAATCNLNVIGDSQFSMKLSVAQPNVRTHHAGDVPFGRSFDFSIPSPCH